MKPFDTLLGGAKKGPGRYQGNDGVFGAMFGEDRDRPTGGKGIKQILDRKSEPVEYDGRLYYQLKEKDKGQEVPTRLFIPVDAVKDDQVDWSQIKTITTSEMEKAKTKPKTVSQAGDRSGPLGALEYDLG